MILTGDVTTRTNCDPPVCSWLDNTPTGTIMLGVDPTSPYTSAWDGGTATAEVFLPNVYTRTVVVLKLSWPDRDGKGLRSPERNRLGAITLDGWRLWHKRTTDLSTSNDYYAAEHEPILTSMVLTQSITHTLSFSVSARTAWDLSQIELIAYPYPTATKGIGYSPFRDCQYPGGERQPSIQDLREDLFRLFHTSNAIRTYSATGVNGQIPPLANAISLPVFAGAWIDYPKTTMEQDDTEIQALIDLACTTDLEGAIVGNEYYLRHRSADAISYLLQRIREVRNGILASCGRDVPVTTAEVDDLIFGWEGTPPIVITGTYPAYRPIVEEVDFVMVHIYPFWYRMPIDGAAAFTVDRYKAMRALIEQEYPGQGKWVILGEGGWPSGGESNGPAAPSPRNQQKYMLEFLPLAEQEGVEFMYFDAFDELWKIEEPGRVGQHWGYSYTDRAAKYSFYGMLLPSEQLADPTQFLEQRADFQQLSSFWTHLPLFAKNEVYRPDFPVFTEWPMGPDEHFVPSGWMGDIGSIGLYECERADPHSGELAVRVSFSPTGTLGWGGIYWQYPENNWGTISRTIDLSYTNKLTFWAKGEEGDERIRFFVGGIGTKNDPYPDSLRPQVSTGFIQLTNQWQKYTINLLLARPEPSYGQDLSRVIGGFGWATDKCANPAEVTFYLDDIVFEHDPNLTPLPPPSSVFAIYTDAAAQGNHYFPTGWMGDAEAPGRVSLTECWPDNPHSEQTSIRVAYTREVIGWAGLYWVHPAENWGDRPGGYDLTEADRLTFWARSEASAWVKFLIGGIGYPVDYRGRADCGHASEPYPDSVCPKIERWVQLSPTWTKHTIDLHEYSRNWSKVVGGFGWVAENPVTFYLDDVVYEFD
jgi:exo-beta-1,3-glucanase (GH17 family)